MTDTTNRAAAGCGRMLAAAAERLGRWARRGPPAPLRGQDLSDHLARDLGLQQVRERALAHERRRRPPMVPAPDALSGMAGVRRPRRWLSR